MKIWLLRTSTKKISHKASWKLRPKNMKMVFSPWNASNIFRPPKTQSQRSFQISTLWKAFSESFAFVNIKFPLYTWFLRIPIPLFLYCTFSPQYFVVLLKFPSNKFINLCNPHIAELIGSGCITYNHIENISNVVDLHIYPKKIVAATKMLLKIFF